MRAHCRPAASNNEPAANDRQSVASQFSYAELQDFLADDYVEKFKTRSRRRLLD